ncbi:hypothetical protein [Streptomyces griseorubiginosus]|uniref:Uncharacterized protein n=1 Tax=Streptomyces griseorubiginosus TaxID=67304 RepID=A0AAI8KSR5_9ACTN|nr:hypothetical protein [Streptomyces griseorubiginosus]AYC36429.1 hypothetical protein DWG14_00639 [Streptomyces griseorubiginosus]
MHEVMVRRIVRYGHAFNPPGKVTPEQMQTLKSAMAAAGRDIADLEMIGGTRAVFPDDPNAIGTFCREVTQCVQSLTV